jgi:hypothetical protein
MIKGDYFKSVRDLITCATMLTETLLLRSLIDHIGFSEQKVSLLSGIVTLMCEQLRFLVSYLVRQAVHGQAAHQLIKIVHVNTGRTR